jgi:hypothetical protein
MSLDDELAKHLGIRKEDIDVNKLVEKVIEEFIFHEDMAEMTMNRLAQAIDQTAEFTAAFDVYNNMSYLLRDILLKASDKEDNATERPRKT